jgi:hypothetical protein
LPSRCCRILAGARRPRGAIVNLKMRPMTGLRGVKARAGRVDAHRRIVSKISVRAAPSRPSRLRRASISSAKLRIADAGALADGPDAARLFLEVPDEFADGAFLRDPAAVLGEDRDARPYGAPLGSASPGASAPAPRAGRSHPARAPPPRRFRITLGVPKTPRIARRKTAGKSDSGSVVVRCSKINSPCYELSYRGRGG